MKLHEI